MHIFLFVTVFKTCIRCTYDACTCGLNVTDNFIFRSKKLYGRSVSRVMFRIHVVAMTTDDRKRSRSVLIEHNNYLPKSQFLYPEKDSR